LHDGQGNFRLFHQNPNQQGLWPQPRFITTVQHLRGVRDSLLLKDEADFINAGTRDYVNSKWQVWGILAVVFHFWGLQRALGHLPSQLSQFKLHVKKASGVFDPSTVMTKKDALTDDHGYYWKRTEHACLFLCQEEFLRRTRSQHPYHNMDMSKYWDCRFWEGRRFWSLGMANTQLDIAMWLAATRGPDTCDKDELEPVTSDEWEVYENVFECQLMIYRWIESNDEISNPTPDKVVLVRRPDYEHDADTKWERPVMHILMLDNEQTMEQHATLIIDPSKFGLTLCSNCHIYFEKEKDFKTHQELYPDGNCRKKLTKTIYVNAENAYNIRKPYKINNNFKTPTNRGWYSRSTVPATWRTAYTAKEIFQKSEFAFRSHRIWNYNPYVIDVDFETMRPTKFYYSDKQDADISTNTEYSDSILAYCGVAACNFDPPPFEECHDADKEDVFDIMEQHQLDSDTSWMDDILSEPDRYQFCITTLDLDNPVFDEDASKEIIQRTLYWIEQKASNLHKWVNAYMLECQGVNPDILKSVDEREWRQYTQTPTLPCEPDTMKRLKSKINYIIKSTLRMSKSKVYTWNGGRFDIYLIMNHGVVQPHKDEDGYVDRKGMGQSAFDVICQQGSLSSISLSHIDFKDGIRLFPGKLHKFLDIYAPTQSDDDAQMRKLFFPHDLIRTSDDLKKGFPNYEQCVSTFTMQPPSEEEYDFFKRLFTEHQCETMNDWVKIYATNDVVPLLFALLGFCKRYWAINIDPIGHNMGIPSIAEKVGYQEAVKKGITFDVPPELPYRALDMYGRTGGITSPLGAAYCKIGQKITDHEQHNWVVKWIGGYDCTSMYPATYRDEMPTRYNFMQFPNNAYPNDPTLCHCEPVREYFKQHPDEKELMEKGEYIPFINSQSPCTCYDTEKDDSLYYSPFLHNNNDSLIQDMMINQVHLNDLLDKHTQLQLSLSKTDTKYTEMFDIYNKLKRDNRNVCEDGQFAKPLDRLQSSLRQYSKDIMESNTLRVHECIAGHQLGFYTLDHRLQLFEGVHDQMSINKIQRHWSPKHFNTSGIPLAFEMSFHVNEHSKLPNAIKSFPTVLNIQFVNHVLLTVLSTVASEHLQTFQYEMQKNAKNHDSKLNFFAEVHANTDTNMKYINDKKKYISYAFWFPCIFVSLELAEYIYNILFENLKNYAPTVNWKYVINKDEFLGAFYPNLDGYPGHWYEKETGLMHPLRDTLSIREPIGFMKWDELEFIRCDYSKFPIKKWYLQMNSTHPETCKYHGSMEWQTFPTYFKLHHNLLEAVQLAGLKIHTDFDELHQQNPNRIYPRHSDVYYIMNHWVRAAMINTRENGKFIFNHKAYPKPVITEMFVDKINNTLVVDILANECPIAKGSHSSACTYMVIGANHIGYIYCNHYKCKDKKVKINWNISDTDSSDVNYIHTILRNNLHIPGVQSAYNKLTGGKQNMHNDLWIYLRHHIWTFPTYMFAMVDIRTKTPVKYANNDERTMPFPHIPKWQTFTPDDIEGISKTDMLNKGIPKTETVVLQHEGNRVLLSHNRLLYLLMTGRYRIAKIHWQIFFNSERPWKDWVDAKMTEREIAEKEGNPSASAQAKLELNSMFGRSMMRNSTFTDTKIVHTSTLWESIMNPLFKYASPMDQGKELWMVTLRKKVIKQDRNIQVGAAILQDSKLFLYTFVDRLLQHPTLKVLLLYTDTDCIIFASNSYSKSGLKTIWGSPEDYPYLADVVADKKHKIPGTFGLEKSGHEIVILGAKQYILATKELSEESDQLLEQINDGTTSIETTNLQMRDQLHKELTSGQSVSSKGVPKNQNWWILNITTYKKALFNDLPLTTRMLGFVKHKQQGGLRMIKSHRSISRTIYKRLLHADGYLSTPNIEYNIQKKRIAYTVNWYREHNITYLHPLHCFYNYFPNAEKVPKDNGKEKKDEEDFEEAWNQ